jgi:putative adenylate-forming enzyme
MINRALDLFAFAKAFCRHRWGFRFKDRQELADYQQRQIARARRRQWAKFKFYASRVACPWDEIPVVGKKNVLESFADFNRYGISLQAARAHASEAERRRDFRPTLPGTISVGSSSGTSGLPSLFLVSQRERVLWAGAVLGRMLSSSSLRLMINPFARPLRIAFFLRANNNLYTALHSSRIQFVFFDLAVSLQSHQKSLSLYEPDVLVAPASVLRHLAEWQQNAAIHINPRQVISVAEKLEDHDARAVVAAWGTAPQQIYQCTEGFLGHTCSFGSLHLNEEWVLFEPQWQDTEKRRFTAVITDFERSSQSYIRHQMDDVLQINPSPCPCGRVALRLESIEGRQDEVLWLPDIESNSLKPIFPDQLRRALMMAPSSLGDYQLEQRGLRFALSVRDSASRNNDLMLLESELRSLCETLAVRMPAVDHVSWNEQSGIEKRRRIRCSSVPELRELA